MNIDDVLYVGYEEIENAFKDLIDDEFGPSEPSIMECHITTKRAYALASYQKLSVPVKVFLCEM